jgi:hypothetical protein
MKSNNKRNILRFKTFLIIITLLTTTFSVFAAANNDNNYDQITKKYTFDMPHIYQVIINDNIYDKVVMPNSPEAGNPREPNLPVHEVQLLLPPETEIKDVDVIPGERVFLGSDFNVEPVGQPVKLSDTDSFFNLIQDESIYSSDHPFPEKLFSEIRTYSFRGYEILVMLLHPIQYIPNSGELYYFKEMTISIKTFENNQINPLFRNIENDQIEATKKVDNPLSVKSYTKKTTGFLSSDDYDLLIITTTEFKLSFQPLKNAHDAEGIKTEIKTLEDISLFPDSVTPEDIRIFIKDEYINSGIEYVLIGGDNNVIPTKYLWVQASAGGDRDFIPSDAYYACLDGTYNYDDDERWGEPTDGKDGKDIDLIAEVYVGRACVGSTEEVDNFVDKTIVYMTSGGYASGKSLMVGEKLWSTPETWGGDYVDEIINESNANMYSTLGIPSNQYTIDTLYDRDWPDNNWPTSEIVSRINNGSLIINHVGHSSYGYVMKMTSFDILSLTNDDPCFIYSQGCRAGGFDNGDCIAEHFTVKTGNAAFAVIMNARYGWAAMGSTNGASQRFHRQFWDAVFGENITKIGKANQDSKEDILSQINYPCMRWCYYQLNLFGDPTLAFYSIENNPPTKPAKPSGVIMGRIGKEYNLKTISTDEDGDMIYYRWDFGDGTFSDWLGPFDSGKEAKVSHNWSKVGKYTIKVKARDEHRVESEWSYQTIVRIRIFSNGPLLDLIFKFLEKYFPDV